MTCDGSHLKKRIDKHACRLMQLVSSPEDVTGDARINDSIFKLKIFVSHIILTPYYGFISIREILLYKDCLFLPKKWTYISKDTCIFDFGVLTLRLRHAVVQAPQDAKCLCSTQ